MKRKGREMYSKRFNFHNENEESSSVVVEKSSGGNKKIKSVPHSRNSRLDVTTYI